MAKKSWLEVVAACKKSIGNQKKGYSQSGYIDVTVDGKTINTRRDCSGFVSVCLSFYTGKKLLTSSSGFSSDSNVAKYMTNAGFSKMDWPGWSGTQAGDIYVVNGHVEICAKSGTKDVYNCGSNDSNNNPGVTKSGHNSYTYIWRPGNPGTGGQILSTGSAVSSDGGANTTDSSSGENIFSKLSSGFSNIWSAATNGILTNNANVDLANAWKGTDSGTSTTDSGTDSGASNDASYNGPG